MAVTSPLYIGNKRDQCVALLHNIGLHGAGPSRSTATQSTDSLLHPILDCRDHSVKEALESSVSDRKCTWQRASSPGVAQFCTVVLLNPGSNFC